MTRIVAVCSVVGVVVFVNAMMALELELFEAILTEYGRASVGNMAAEQWPVT